MQNEQQTESRGVSIFKTLIVLTLGGVVVLMGVSMMFGSVLKSKYQSARNSVHNDVTIGGGSYDGGSAISVPRASQSAPVVVHKPAPQAAPQPQHQPPIQPTAPAQAVNPLTQTAQDRFSTFAVDVDTASYTIARRLLKEGIVPSPQSVRVEEFVNYFRYDYPNPDAGAFGVNLEAAPSPFTSRADKYLLRVGVQGKRIAPKDRKPVHLTFLVDVSGSMSSPNKLGLAKQSIAVLVRQLTEKDTVALVTYAGSTEVVLPATPALYKNKILNALDKLHASGSTAMESGMTLAYREASKVKKPGHVSRVIVLSDGDANIGNTSYTEMLNGVSQYVKQGVTLSTIGFGMGNYKDTLMEQLANKGNGNYYYIDSFKEARKVFGEQVNGTLEVIAKDVKVQVEFNPKVVKSYRLIGYENRDIADKDFRNDQVDAGEIGAGHTVTAMYELILHKPKLDKQNVGYVRVRAKKPEGEKAKEQIFTLSSAQFAPKLSKASKDFQFAAAVTAFAEVLRKSPYAEGLSLDLISELASANTAHTNEERGEFLKLVKKARALKVGQLAQR